MRFHKSCGSIQIPTGNVNFKKWTNVKAMGVVKNKIMRLSMGWSSEVPCLPSMHEALDPSPALTHTHTHRLEDTDFY
jgi:hypothetical protein